jgi:hypothetical protein
MGIFATIFLNFYTYLDTFFEWHRISHCEQDYTYPNGESRLDIFLQAMFQDDAEDELSKKSFRYHFWALTVVKEWSSCLQQIHLQDYPNFDNALIYMGAIMFWLSNLLYYGRLFEPSSGYFEGNYFGRTEKFYIASIPPDTAVGDSVMLIKGSQVPLVLRRVNSSWHLVGHAYVPGLMEGEQWDEGKCGPIRIN